MDDVPANSSSNAFFYDKPRFFIPLWSLMKPTEAIDRERRWGFGEPLGDTAIMAASPGADTGKTQLRLRQDDLTAPDAYGDPHPRLVADIQVRAGVGITVSDARGRHRRDDRHDTYQGGEHEG